MTIFRCGWMRSWISDKLFIRNLNANILSTKFRRIKYVRITEIVDVVAKILFLLGNIFNFKNREFSHELLIFKAFIKYVLSTLSWLFSSQQIQSNQLNRSIQKIPCNVIFSNVFLFFGCCLVYRKCFIINKNSPLHVLYFGIEIAVCR